jgi:hypothetical protein
MLQQLAIARSAHLLCHFQIHDPTQGRNISVCVRSGARSSPLVKGNQESPPPLVTHPGSTDCAPSIMSEATDDIAKLCLHEGEGVLDIVALLVKGSCLEVVL